MTSTTPRPDVGGAPADGTPTTERQAAGKGVARRVFWPALALVLAFSVFTLAAPETAGSLFARLQSGVVGGLGWYYVLLVAVFVGFSIWVGAGRFGSIKLGRDDDEPEFGLLSWFAMLFATGMGIGLVFWGVAEPLNHFASPPPGTSGTTEQLAQQALTQTYLHWGIHAWAIYVVAGLGIAYAVHRRGRPVSIRWALEPLLGSRVRGRLGDVIDVVAIVGTVFGVATSLGLGVLQIGAGFEFLGWSDDGASPWLLVPLIVVISAIAMGSVLSGLEKGIKWLSSGNMVLAAVVLVAVLVAGPTLFLLRDFVQSIGAYLQDVVRLTFNVSAFQGAAGEEWQASWTTYYWGWWMSWAPFVGVFIARISKGRTVREFVAGVLLVPTTVTFLWFSVLGGSALYAEIFGDGGYVGADGSVDTESTLFTLLESIPGGALWAVVGLLLIAVFFVTSSDSGSLVMTMLATGGDPEPPRWHRALWASTSGLVAIGLLLTGGLEALQTGAILTALPFSLVMIGILVALVRAFRWEHQKRQRILRRVERRETAEELHETLTGSVTEAVIDELGGATPVGRDDGDAARAADRAAGTSGAPAGSATTGRHLR